MKTFKEFSEQLVSGRAQPATPAQRERHREISASRSAQITRQLRSRSGKELSGHEANLRAILARREG